MLLPLECKEKGMTLPLKKSFLRVNPIEYWASIVKAKQINNFVVAELCVVITQCMMCICNALIDWRSSDFMDGASIFCTKNYMHLFWRSLKASDCGVLYCRNKQERRHHKYKHVWWGQKTNCILKVRETHLLNTFVLLYVRENDMRSHSRSKWQKWKMINCIFTEQWKHEETFADDVINRKVCWTDQLANDNKICNANRLFSSGPTKQNMLYEVAKCVLKMCQNSLDCTVKVWTSLA